MNALEIKSEPEGIEIIPSKVLSGVTITEISGISLLEILKHALCLSYNNAGTCKIRGELTKAVRSLFCQGSLMWVTLSRMCIASLLSFYDFMILLPAFMILVFTCLN